MQRAAGAKVGPWPGSAPLILAIAGLGETLAGQQDLLALLLHLLGLLEGWQQPLGLVVAAAAVVVGQAGQFF